MKILISNSSVFFSDVRVLLNNDALLRYLDKYLQCLDFLSFFFGTGTFSFQDDHPFYCTLLYLPNKYCSGTLGYKKPLSHHRNCYHIGMFFAKIENTRIL
jgi:hypothetical protein